MTYNLKRLTYINELQTPMKLPTAHSLLCYGGIKNTVEVTDYIPVSSSNV